MKYYVLPYDLDTNLINSLEDAKQYVSTINTYHDSYAPNIREIHFKMTASSKLHFHDFFELLFVLDGRIKYKLYNIDIHLTKGASHFIFPETIHRFTIDKTLIEGTLVNIAFPPYFMDKSTLTLLEKANSNNDNKMNIMNIGLDIINILYKKVVMINKSKDIKYQKAILNSMLTDYLSEYILRQESEEKNAPNWLIHSINEMRNDNNYIIGLERFVDISQRSQEHLTRSVKKYLGITPTAYINDLRLEYSHDLLLKTDNAILDIANISGFNNISYFEKVFKKKFHQTPSKYRIINTHPKITNTVQE